jgi:NADP-dependent aldehyde dehydrogenase
LTTQTQGFDPRTGRPTGEPLPTTSGRSDPIPFYGELGSVNPVVVLPGAARERTASIAREYAASLTQGTGQFCTNPGLLFVPQDVTGLLAAIAEEVGQTLGGPGAGSSH